MRFPTAVDPMTEDPRDQDERAAEAQRFQDERTLCDLFAANPYRAVHDVALAYGPYEAPFLDWLALAYGWRTTDTTSDSGVAARVFAADYGWPAVFRVLAAAIHAYDDAQSRR